MPHGTVGRFLLIFCGLLGALAAYFLVQQDGFIQAGQQFGDQGYESDESFLRAVWWGFYFLRAAILIVLPISLIAAFILQRADRWRR